MCLCGGVTPEYRYPWRLEEGVESLGIGITGGCVLFGMAAGNLIQVLCKTNKCS